MWRIDPHQLCRAAVRKVARHVRRPTEHLVGCGVLRLCLVRRPVVRDRQRAEAVRHGAGARAALQVVHDRPCQLRRRRVGAQGGAADRLVQRGGLHRPFPGRLPLPAPLKAALRAGAGPAGRPRHGEFARHRPQRPLARDVGARVPQALRVEGQGDGPHLLLLRRGRLVLAGRGHDRLHGLLGEAGCRRCDLGGRGPALDARDAAGGEAARAARVRPPIGPRRAERLPRVGQREEDTRAHRRVCGAAWRQGCSLHHLLPVAHGLLRLHPGHGHPGALAHDHSEISRHQPLHLAGSEVRPPPGLRGHDSAADRPDVRLLAVHRWLRHGAAEHGVPQALLGPAL
mmetsp:Transcript_41494/g.129038  ORF Transcript_41494/g.129038 Transcript_41494/m.129038 type:complete len:342 (+) Transcript_41494:132-1157(+)